MTKEDQELLDTVRHWRPGSELHPIAKHAITLHDQAGHRITPRVLEGLREKLDGMRDDLPEMARAIETLVRFSLLLTGEHDDRAGGEAILALLQEFIPLFGPLFLRVSEAFENVGQESQSVFFSFSGKSEEKIAPKFGAKTPAGFMPLSQLVAPARPPVWARKHAHKTN